MLKNKHLIDDDFDHWFALSKKNPDVFEVRREACIEALILSAPISQQPRLRGLQWQIDLKRQRAKNPMAACMAISNMMWDQVLGEGGLLERLRQTSNPSVFVDEQDEEAVVIPFKSPSNPAGPLYI